MWIQQHFTFGNLYTAVQKFHILNRPQSYTVHVHCLLLRAKHRSHSAEPLGSHWGPPHRAFYLPHSPALVREEHPIEPWAQASAGRLLGRGIKRKFEWWYLCLQDKFLPSLMCPNLGISAVLFYARRPHFQESCEMGWTEVIRYDSYFTGKETESQSLMIQLKSGSARTKTLSFCISSLSKLTPSSIGQQANLVLETGTNLVTAGVWGSSLPAKVTKHCSRRSPTCTHCVFYRSLWTFRDLHLTIRLPISTPPAFLHANDNLFQLNFNNLLWEFSKTSSAKQPGKEIGLEPTQYFGQRRPSNHHFPTVRETDPWAQVPLPQETNGNFLKLLKFNYVRGVMFWNLSLCFSYLHFSVNDLLSSIIDGESVWREEY